jgi:hypothetical protein
MLGPTDRRRRPPEMVAEAIRLPGGDAVAGKPVTLLAAVSSAFDRRQQLEIVLAYWRLAQAVAEYHYCLDHTKAFETSRSYGRRLAEDASVLAEQAAAEAQVHETQLGAVRAQYDLAALLRSAASEPLPLPADRPHVGPYRTNFKELFADRTPPEFARLAERILPVQWQQVDKQAEAVQAAEDALAAVGDDYRNGRGAAAAVTSCSRELLRQQRALIRAVCAYNRNIADYCFSVVGPAATPQELVGRLIFTADTPTGRPVSDGGKAVRPTSAEEPVGAEARRGWSRGEPTPAPPRDDPQGSISNDSPPAAPLEQLQPVGTSEPQLVPPPARPAREPADIPETRVVPVESQAPTTDPFPPSTSPSPPNPPSPKSAPSLRTARKVPRWDSDSSDDDYRRSGTAQGGLRSTDSGFGGRSDAAGARYAGLTTASPGTRTKQLAASIYSDQGTSHATGRSIALVECLFRNANSDRLTTIRAYWLLSQRQAGYRILLAQKETLGAIEQTVIEHRSDPTGPADMLRLQSAKLATEAAIFQAQAALIEAQYALALRIGTVAEAAWPLASTPPHSGSYLLKLDSQPRGLAQSWPVRRLAAVIPRLGETVQGLAAAVVEADAAQAAATENYRMGRGGIDAVLEGVQGQIEETCALLSCLTDYNDAIAEYSLTVLPATYPADKLAASLVVKP